MLIPRKKMIEYVFLAISIVVLVILYLRWFERHNIFFPTRKIELRPDYIGLTYEDVYFDSADGVRLNGWFIPASRSSPTILLCHGNAGNIGHRLGIIRLFNRSNLNVFIFDYRGYGQSSGRPSEKGTYLDARAAYDYLVSRSDIDKDKIIFYGKSLGGAVAVDLASRVNPCAVIIESAFTSTLDIARELYPFLPVRLMVTMKYDTLSKIKGLRAPKLIIHSIDDEIVPFHHGRRLFEDAAGPRQFYQMSGGHNEAVSEAEDEFAERIDKFLSAYGIR